MQPPPACPPFPEPSDTFSYSLSADLSCKAQLAGWYFCVESEMVDSLRGLQVLPIEDVENEILLTPEEIPILFLSLLPLAILQGCVHTVPEVCLELDGGAA